MIDMPNSKCPAFVRLIEQGDYEVYGQEIADCSICGMKQVECQVLTHETKETVNVCMKCSGEGKLEYGEEISQ
jgi:hypothetical protein